MSGLIELTAASMLPESSNAPLPVRGTVIEKEEGK